VYTSQFVTKIVIIFFEARIGKLEVRG